jgi:FixJ family two-component response regulator
MPDAPWIAIVDDDASVLNALARLLRTRGRVTRTFTSADAFLAALLDSPPECLIVDLQMPDMDGFELLRRIAFNKACIPTIVITAHSEPDARDRAASAGVYAFLAKPIQDTLLLAAIDDAIGDSRTRGRARRDDEESEG